MVAGVDDEPTYTRSVIVNKAEEVSIVLNSAQFTDEDYVTEKVLTILGDKDQIETVMEKKAAVAMQRMAGGMPADGQEITENGETGGVNAEV